MRQVFDILKGEVCEVMPKLAQGSGTDDSHAIRYSNGGIRMATHDFKARSDHKFRRWVSLEEAERRGLYSLPKPKVKIQRKVKWNAARDEVGEPIQAPYSTSPFLDLAYTDSLIGKTGTLTFEEE